MGFAANTIADAIAPPPPPARGSNARADDASAPSFQDHVDAADQQRSDAQQARHDARDRASAASSSSSPASVEQSDTATAASTQPAQEDSKQTAEAPAAPTQPAVLVQLIASVATATIGAKAEQSAPSPQDTAATNQAAIAGANQAAATLAAVATPPAKTAPKSDAATRTPHVKTAKGATEKTTATSDDAKSAALQAPTPTIQGPNAQPATTPIVAPTIASSDGKDDSAAKAQGIEAAQSAPARSPQHAQQAAPPAPASPVSEPATAVTAQPDATETKGRDTAKALAPLEALKQAAQDLTAAAPKAQVAPPTPPPTATHTQLAEPVQQAANDTTTARAAPAAAAQVGGEIIRRFNGQDTSFQMRLDPPELGRVDVRVDVSRDHRVTAVISADSPQALSDLARGARDLQQALQSAGLDLGDDGLRFNLSSNGQGSSFAQAQAQQDQSAWRGANNTADPVVTPEATVSRPLSIDSWRGARVDLVA